MIINVVLRNLLTISGLYVLARCVLDPIIHTHNYVITHTHTHIYIYIYYIYIYICV